MKSLANDKGTTAAESTFTDLEGATKKTYADSPQPEWLFLQRILGDSLDQILEEIRQAIEGPQTWAFAFRKADETDFPVVRIDRKTAQDLLPIFMNRGIFTDYEGLRAKEDILKEAIRKKGGGDLTLEEERQALSEVGRYRSGGYVITDYGDYAIGFSAKLYIDYLEGSENDLKQAWKTASTSSNERIKQSLKGLRLYKLAHKLAYAILCEVFIQKRLKGLFIPKKRLVEYLGHDASEKRLYRQIKDALLTLRWLDYKIYDFSYTDIKRLNKRGQGKMVGNFIYNLGETPKEYILDVNERFVGCATYLMGEKMAKKDRKEAFRRGYFPYPSSLLPLSRGYSTSAYLLMEFLVRDSGNKKVSRDGVKCVVYKVERFIREMQLHHSRADRQYMDFLRALNEVEIIKDISPPIEGLRKLTPSKGLKTQITISIPKNVEKLTCEIKGRLESKSTLLGAK